MPSPKRPGTKRILAQVPADVHAKADARRRVEKTTWDRVISTLLQRWSDGDEGAVTAPVRKARLVQAPPEPGTARAEYIAFSERWDRENPELAKKAAAPVDITKLKRYRSFGELLAADAARAGRVIPPEIIAEIDADEGSDG